MKFEISSYLRDAIKNDQLVIFIGAGLSVSNDMPDWHSLVKGLLENEGEYIEKSSAYLNALEDSILEPLEVLDKIEKDKKKIYDYFEKRLKKTVDSEVHKKLSTITGKFVTTNFDTLIEDNSSIDTIVTHDSDFNLSKIDNYDSYIVKIHGDISRVDKCIIFSSQYEELYSEEKLASFQLKKIFSSFNVLFLGFSMRDPYVKDLFEHVSGLYDGFGKKHFAVFDRNVELNGIDVIDISSYENISNFVNYIYSIKKEGVEKDIDTLEKQDGVVNVREVDSGDIPPEVERWVGREKELLALNNDSFKVVAITGFGGEGKSALASHYLNELSKVGECEILEWRDFKEEDHRFQSKICSMISSVCNDIVPEDVAGLNDDELISMFFLKLGDKKAVFVLDNVDSYIDLETFIPVNGIGKLFNMAMDVEHNAKFIFTCRPFITYAGAEFFQLSLLGLRETSTLELFRKSSTQIPSNKIDAVARKSHKLTNGHALWLNLIVAQARRGENVVNDFLNSISSGSSIAHNDSSLLSEHVLGSIWGTLNTNHKLVLRTLAESVRAETVEDYAEILSSELTFNKFGRVLNSLKNMNLLINKRDTDYIELHPLVKEFIRKNYQTSDRSRYISMLIKYYDKYVLVLKKVLSHKLSFDEFVNFTNKAELSINAGDFQNAISTLSEIHSSMSSAGYIEEFLRVSKLLFNSVTWTKKSISKYSSFESLLSDTVKSAVERDENRFADSLINKFESLIENKEAAYIRLCSIKVYASWFRGDYKKAIELADEALYMLNRGGQDDSYSLAHNQHLAYRDRGDSEGINKALDYFVGINDLDDLVKKENFNTHGDGTLFGNVGRCFALKNEYDNALVCYYKSFHYIFGGDGGGDRLINIGYASLWISEVLFEKNMKESALYFNKYAMEVLRSSSPVLANRNLLQWPGCKDDSTYNSIMSQELWRVEKYCLDWIYKEVGLK